VVVKIYHRLTKALIDSGAGVSLISKHLADKLRVQIQNARQESLGNLLVANSSKLHVSGITDIQLNLKGLIIPQTFYVVENLGQNLILGSDFLRTNRVVLNFNTRTISIWNDLLHLPLQTPGFERCIGRMAHSVCVAPFTEQLVEVKCNSRYNSQDVLLEELPGRQFSPIAVARSISKTVK
jgi:hypothetical protein